MIEHGGQSWQVTENYGGASRDRTDDLIVANDALSQLSYSPTRQRVEWLRLVHFTSAFLLTPNVATPNLVACDLCQTPN